MLPHKKIGTQHPSSPQFHTDYSRGFTIVELLIVVVVIAILAAIVIVAYNGIQGRARNSAAQTTVKQASTKVLTYAALNNDAFPANLAAIGISDSSDTTYQYIVNNTTTPRTFCIAATVSSVSYFVSNSTSTPTAGTCAVSIFGSNYPYTATLWNDGGGSLKLATIFYSYASPFTVKGGRVYLPSVPSGASLTIFYVKGWNMSGTVHQPDWSQIPSSIPGQYVTIPQSSLVTGWNTVTFPTSAVINPYSAGVDGTSVWVGYYFSDGNGYIYTTSPTNSAIASATNSNLFLAESTFEGHARSSNSLSDASGWSSALYGIDILTVGP